MKNKLLAGALFAFGALLSFSASAAVTFSNTNPWTARGGAQAGGNTLAAAGGDSVRANDIVLGMAGIELVPSSGSNLNTPTVAVKLPAGINFDGTPTFTVSQATAGLGLTLKDVADDPTTTVPKITLSDTDGDGGMDRALVSVRTSSAAGDTLTVSVNLKVGAGVAVGAKSATVILGASVPTSRSVNLVTVTKDFVEPVFQAFKPVITAQNKSGVASPTSSFIVTIPKGTKGGATMTLTVGSKMYLSHRVGSGGVSSTVTATQLTPAKQTVFTAMTRTAANPTVKFLTFTVSGTTSYTVPDDVQVSFNLDNYGQTPTTTITGLQGLKVGGPIVSGQVNYIDIRKNGSSAALAKGAKAAKIVSGSKSAQSLPAISITENFDQDLVNGTTKTITLTPGAGLKLETATVSVTGTGWSATNAAATATISTAGIMTIKLNNASGGSLTVTIGSLKATASKVGSLTLTVGNPGTGAGKDLPTAPKDVLTVATGVAVGTVSAALKKPAVTTGPGNTGSSQIVLKESTYGAISTAKKTQSTVAYFSVDISDNAKLTGVTVANALYPATAPNITATCSKDTILSSTYICTVSGESNAVTAGTSTVTVTANWSTLPTASVGSEVVLTLGGNAEVSGEFKVATLATSTKTTVGAIPDVKPGSLTAVSLAPVTITGMFANAVTSTSGATFRLLAPAGVSFQDAAATASSTSISAATISSTFRPNDTLSLAIAKTATITFTPKAIFSTDSGSGLVSFEMVDGDINGKNPTLITPATLELAYVDGTLSKLDAGKAASVNVGFSVSNTATGGLAPYTVASSDSKVGSPTITGNVVTVSGKAVGAATITVKDALGATSTYVVTVEAGAAEPAQGKATKASDGSASTATFTGGASIDGGATYSSKITTADEVTINATINVDAADVGKKGGIHAVALTPVGLLMLNADGTWEKWDGEIASIATYQEEATLAASYKVPLYSGAITAGKWRFAVIYSTIVDGKVEKLVYTTKAALLTVTEAE